MATTEVPRSRKRPRNSSSRHFSKLKAVAAAIDAEATASVASTPEKRGQKKSRFFLTSWDSPYGAAVAFPWATAHSAAAAAQLRACDKYEDIGIRHLCTTMCYYWAFEPIRQWQALAAALVAAHESPTRLRGWSITLDYTQPAAAPPPATAAARSKLQKARGWALLFVTPEGHALDRPAAMKALGLGRTKADTADAKPLRSGGGGDARRRPRAPPPPLRFDPAHDAARVCCADACWPETAAALSAEQRHDLPQRGPGAGEHDEQQSSRENEEHAAQVQAGGAGVRAASPAGAASSDIVSKQDGGGRAPQRGETAPGHARNGGSAAAQGPPLSPFGLLEELLWYDPWRLLMACIMLNQTSRRQVDPVLAQFLDTHPTPESAAKADPTALAPMLKPLGLNKKRPVAVVRFSREYLAWRSGRVGKAAGGKLQQTLRTVSPVQGGEGERGRGAEGGGGAARASPEALHWVGQYGVDAYDIFVLQKWETVTPDDSVLRCYVDWARGAALARSAGGAAGASDSELEESPRSARRAAPRALPPPLLSAAAKDYPNALQQESAGGAAPLTPQRAAAAAATAQCVSPQGSALQRGTGGGAVLM